MHNPPIVLLLDDAETMSALNISAEDLEWLIATQQLPPIYIRSRRRFRLSDIEAMVNAYCTVQHRN